MRLDSLLPLIRNDAGYRGLVAQLPSLESTTRRQTSDPRPETRGPRPETREAIAVRFSVLDAAKPAILAALHGDLARPTIVLVSRLARARQLADELAAWSEAPDRVYLFPELDALPYERLLPGPEALYERLRAMLALARVLSSESRVPGPLDSRPEARDSGPFVVVTARAAMDRLMAPEACQAATWRIRVGQRIRPERLLAEWVRAGYEPVAVVEGPGEFARRGDIIDIFPVGAGSQSPETTARSSMPAAPSPLASQPWRRGQDRPAQWQRLPAVRVELWGNDVERIRSFDPATQRSADSIEEIVLGPAQEVLPSLPPQCGETLRALNLEGLKARERDDVQNEIRMLQEGQSFPLLEWYRGFLGTASILDYLPPSGLLVVDEPGAVAATARELHRQAAELYADLMVRGEAPGGMPRPYWTWEELFEATGNRQQATGSSRLTPHASRLDLVLDPDALDAAFVPAPTYSGRLPELIEKLSSEFGVLSSEGQPRGTQNSELRTRTVIVSQQAARLADMLAETANSSELKVPSSESPPLETQNSELRTQNLGPQSSVLVVHGALGEGWANHTIGLTLLTDREIFGWAKVRRAARRHGVAARERFLSDLEPGELVVHVEHGIGRYRGLVRLADRATAIEREYLDIGYAESGRLLVPAEHADRVSRYIGSGEAVPSLTKLGSGEWQRIKRRIRAAVQRIARDLVELYAKRELAEAPPLEPDTPWQIEVEASFPYVETPDQLEASREVKEDVERARPMDRLLVGDVGYGKTEVALRAAFKAVMSGKQVAILVPTTVLAQQHYNTFRERLAPFPVRVEMLSRFLTDRQAREVVRDIKDAKVDIAIGTHRLLQRDVEFKDLGLVVIDEEQRFGVIHKERFKQLRTEVHVLTMSATPIPRTLHLSLVGVRDLSMIETPPEERLPIRTYVTEHDERLIREAILRELDRGGQVYYVANRVYTILAVAARLAALVPEARIVVAHGQMNDDELEETMLAFANGDADVLVCTTIIEAGLDLPNVNTIVVTNAHQFGLSQLYQLRGRVGRAAVRAYAYFLYPTYGQLSEVAEKRLRAIFEATELGAGYRIALKDLEIRGAGNLLGVEQHGHISAVGFDLYCKLLGEAVEQLKALREESLGEDGLADRVISGAAREEERGSVSLPLPASLPADYVPEEAVRLNLYQRLAAVREGPALGELMAEIEDRFGPLPEPAMHLFYILSLRLAAEEAGVEEISVDGSDLVVRFRGARAVDARALGNAIRAPVEARANQVRLSQGRGSGWMAKLRDLVEHLRLAVAG